MGHFQGNVSELYLTVVKIPILEPVYFIEDFGGELIKRFRPRKKQKFVLLEGSAVAPIQGCEEGLEHAEELLLGHLGFFWFLLILPSQDFLRVILPLLLELLHDNSSVKLSLVLKGSTILRLII